MLLYQLRCSVLTLGTSGPLQSASTLTTPALLSVPISTVHAPISRAHLHIHSTRPDTPPMPCSRNSYTCIKPSWQYCTCNSNLKQCSTLKNLNRPPQQTTNSHNLPQIHTKKHLQHHHTQLTNTQVQPHHLLAHLPTPILASHPLCRQGRARPSADAALTATAGKCSGDSDKGGCAPPPAATLKSLTPRQPTRQMHVSYLPQAWQQELPPLPLQPSSTCPAPVPCACSQAAACLPPQPAPPPLQEASLAAVRSPAAAGKRLSASPQQQL